MDNLALNQKVKVLAVGAAGLLLAVYLGNQIGSENYTPLILGAVVLIVAAVGFFSGRFFWVLTIASSFLSGTFPILGGSFTPFQILMAMGVAKFFVEDVVLRRIRINVGNRFDLFLIAGFMGVLLLHGIHDRFGMKFLGSSVWGGRLYINVFVGLAAFFVIQSIPMSPKLWTKFPYIVLAVNAFDLLIAVITTVFPTSIYAIYPFYSSVSTSGISEIITGSPVETGRIIALGGFGFVVITLILASTSLPKLFSLPNLFRLLGVAVAFLAVLYSSFRSMVLSTLTVFLVAGIRDLKWAVLGLLPFLALILFGLSVVNSQVVALPKQVQRSLSFMPGTWDTNMALDATDSNEFRTRVWTVWRRDYFPQRPWLGRGFGFRSSWAQRSVFKYDPNADVQTVEVGDIHNGFFSTLDAFGVIGTIFFVIWNLRLLARTFRVPFRKNDPDGFALRFIALYLATSIISYWYGAGSVGTFLPTEFAMAGVFLRLQQSVESKRVGDLPTDAKLPHPVSAEAAPA